MRPVLLLSWIAISLSITACDGATSTVAPSHVRWNFQQATADEDGTPHTALELIDAQTDRVLFRTICDGIVSPPELAPDATRHAAAISCEWNDYTVSYGVREVPQGWMVEERTGQTDWRVVTEVQ